MNRRPLIIALTHGATPTRRELAQALECDPSSVSRLLARMRVEDHCDWTTEHALLDPGIYDADSCLYWARTEADMNGE